MNETERKTYLEQFNRRTHVLGRIVSAITLVLLVGAPFLIGTFLGAMPDLGAVAKGFLSVGLVWTVSSVAEFLIYTPMLGAGGDYLAFITGNLINMKIPCAVNARDIVGTKTGTAENEIISTLSIATSSLVTIVVLALGVVMSSGSLGDTILSFAFMSMGLRGCTAFAPLCFLIWAKGKVDGKYALVSIIGGSLVALILGVFNLFDIVKLPCDAVFPGVAVGLIVMFVGYFASKGKTELRKD